MVETKVPPPLLLPPLELPPDEEPPELLPPLELPPDEEPPELLPPLELPPDEELPELLPPPPLLLALASMSVTSAGRDPPLGSKGSVAPASTPFWHGVPAAHSAELPPACVSALSLLPPPHAKR